MAQVYDSGSDVSEKTKELRKDLFNTDIKDPDTNKVADRMDKRSDDKVIITLSLIFIFLPQPVNKCLQYYFI